MRVEELMVKKVETCLANTNLDVIARKMWNGDCGSVAVVDKDNKPIGIITDCDISMGSMINHRPLWELTSEEVTNHRTVFSCHSDDDVKKALKIMKDKRIRRLPVVNAQGELQGVLSVDDIVVAARNGKHGQKNALSSEEVLEVLSQLCGPSVNRKVH
jgi:CBS domain-containing protein